MGGGSKAGYTVVFELRCLTVCRQGIGGLAPWWYCTATPIGVDSWAVYSAVCWGAGGTHFCFCLIVAVRLLGDHAISLDRCEQLGDDGGGVGS